MTSPAFLHQRTLPSVDIEAGRDSLRNESIPITKLEHIKNIDCDRAKSGVWRCNAISGCMISVVIETKNADEGLAKTLSTLVGGVVEGVIRDVVVVDQGSIDHTHQVADAAGATLLQDQPLLDGVRKTRGEWLLLLEPGAKLLDGWIDPVVQHIGSLPGPARFSRNPIHRQPFLARMFGKPAPLAEGLLISKRQALALLKSAKTADDLARGLAARRLKAEIIPAPKTDPRKVERQ